MHRNDALFRHLRTFSRVVGFDLGFSLFIKLRCPKPSNSAGNQRVRLYGNDFASLLSLLRPCLLSRFAATTFLISFQTDSEMHWLQ